jgi:hypothetical protein
MCNKFACTIFVMFLFISNSLLSADGEDKIQKGERFILLATTRTGTMQKEMSEAASNGFRVRMGAPTSGNEMVILMEKLATPPDVYKYQLLATKRTSTMEKELNEAGDGGYRLIPQTVIPKKGISLGIRDNVEVVVIMEKAPKSNTRYQYKLLATTRTSTMEKEIREAESAGFSLIAMCSRDEHLVVMEKELK